jgi:hypothetical protein
MFKGTFAMNGCRLGLFLILALVVGAWVGTAAVGSQRFDATAEASPMAEFFSGPLKVDADSGVEALPFAQGAAGAADRPGLGRYLEARPSQRLADPLYPICVQPRSPPLGMDRIS